MRKIYLASSWRNPEHSRYVNMLRLAGHEVYDYRNPPGKTAFKWENIDPNYKTWLAKEYRDALRVDKVKRGFRSDFGGMSWADTCVILHPCGRSAHLEAGYMAGQGKPTVVRTIDGEEPDLMMLLLSEIVITDKELLDALSEMNRK